MMWVLAEFLHKRTSQLHSGRSTERAKVRNLKGGTHARPHTYTRTHTYTHTVISDSQWEYAYQSESLSSLSGSFFRTYLCKLLMTVINTTSLTEKPDASEPSYESRGWTHKQKDTHVPKDCTRFFYFIGFGPTLGVLTSSTVKFCSRAHAFWGKVKASEEAWGTAGERSRRMPCGSRPTWAEPLVDCREGGKRGRVFDITSKKSLWIRANTEQNLW